MTSNLSGSWHLSLCIVAMGIDVFFHMHVMFREVIGMQSAMISLLQQRKNDKENIVVDIIVVLLATMSVAGNHMIPLPASRQYFVLEGDQEAVFFVVCFFRPQDLVIRSII
jgi:hypothetical protein